MYIQSGRGHSLGQPKLLHQDHGSYHLGWRIRDNQDSNENHRLGWQTNRSLQRGNTKTIHKAVQGLRTKYNGEFNSTILLVKLDHIMNPEAHRALPATIIAIAIIFATGACIWKCCCHSKDTKIPTLSAPPLPMPAQILLTKLPAARILAPAPVPSQPLALILRTKKDNKLLPIMISFTWEDKKISWKKPKEGNRYRRWYFVNPVNIN